VRTLLVKSYLEEARHPPSNRGFDETNRTAGLYSALMQLYFLPRYNRGRLSSCTQDLRIESFSRFDFQCANSCDNFSRYKQDLPVLRERQLIDICRLEIVAIGKTPSC
jgi:hypothetical protein